MIAACNSFCYGFCIGSYLRYKTFIMALLPQLVWSDSAGTSPQGENKPYLNGIPAPFWYGILPLPYFLVLSIRSNAMHITALILIFFLFCAWADIVNVFVYVQRLMESLLSHRGTKNLSLQFQFLPLPLSLATSIWYFLSYLTTLVVLSIPLRFSAQHTLLLHFSFIFLHIYQPLYRLLYENLAYNLLEDLVLQKHIDNGLYCCSCDYTSLDRTFPVYCIITI